jgi:hypothetical protein
LVDRGGGRGVARVHRELGEYKQLETLEAIGWVDGLVGGVVVPWRSYLAAAPAELSGGGSGGGTGLSSPPTCESLSWSLRYAEELRLKAERPALPAYFRAETVGLRIHKLVGLAKRRRGRPAPACSHSCNVAGNTNLK